jgi:hypothetical protein
VDPCGSIALPGFYTRAKPMSPARSAVLSDIGRSRQNSPRDRGDSAADLAEILEDDAE